MFNQRPGQSSGMQVTRGGLSPQEEYIRWAWGQGTGASGGLGPAPLAVQGLRQMAGFMPQAPGGPVNGLGPEFAQLVNQQLFSNVNPGFRVQGQIPQAPGPQNSLDMLNSLVGTPYFEDYYKRTFGR